MTLLPRSLFSRLVLVLLAGLVTAQLVSFAVHMHERSESLLEATGMQSAQRIADIVKLLESLGADERRRVAGVLSAQPMVVRLDQAPLPAVEHDADRTARAALFGAFLRSALGDGRQVEVAVTDSRHLFPGPTSGSALGPHMGGMDGMPGPGGGGMRFHAAMQQYFNQPALSFVAQVRLHDGTRVTFDARQPQETANWPYRLLLSLLVLLGAVVAVSLIAVRWATRPLNVLADAAEELGKNINRPPLAETGPVEVTRAARAFNTMQARLLRYLQDRARAFAAMSHDLKTPITRLRLRAELLDDPALRAKFTGDLGEMEAMVGATLDYMRGVETDEPVQPVDMGALLESLQADLSETGGRITLAAAALRPCRGRPQALKRCLANLLENAVKYGGSADVIAQDHEDRVEICIRDHGPGIPETELERVFDPYYRLEHSRNRQTGGTGLGLSIARSIAENHGGRMTLRNRDEGGLEAKLVLPR
ncbi:MAG: ATP-binding protein [Betaproteobacteria bacterium]